MHVYVLLFTWFWLVNIGILPDHALSYLQWSRSQSDWRRLLYFLTSKQKWNFSMSVFFIEKLSCIKLFQVDWLFFKVSKCQKLQKYGQACPLSFAKISFDSKSVQPFFVSIFIIKKFSLWLGLRAENFFGNLIKVAWSQKARSGFSNCPKWVAKTIQGLNFN